MHPAWVRPACQDSREAKFWHWAFLTSHGLHALLAELCVLSMNSAPFASQEGQSARETLYLRKYKARDSR